MYLIDTNIFLEILLKQENKENCKDFLETHVGQLCLTDFSLHSIGIILLRHNEDKLFTKFLADVLPKIELVSLPKKNYKDIVKNRKTNKLDFDDAYQYTVCKHFDFQLVTMDQDFRKIKDVELMYL